MIDITESARAVLNTLQNPSDATLLDASCKRILSVKGVLAWILKSCVPEFKNVDVKDIEHKYIEGEPEVGVVGVYPDETNVKSETTEAGIRQTTKGGIISGMNTEDITVTEQKVTYDIRFRAAAPNGGGLIALIINVEAQNDSEPGYPLLSRAVYYCCRMISSQKGVEFTGENFQDIKKVYSIWICPKPPVKKRGVIKAFDLTETILEGKCEPEDKADYDLVAIRMIYLPAADGEKGEGILQMLDKLLSPKNTREDKIEVLEQFGIEVTEEVRKEVQNMCDYSSVVLNTGIEEGEEKAKMEMAKSLYADGVSIEKIVKYVKYPVEVVEKWLGLVTV